MALLLYTFLALATFIAATTSRFLDPDKRSSLTPALSLLPTYQGSSVVLLNSTRSVSGLWTDCYDEESKKAGLDPDQCTNALVNSEFASLPPNEVLEFKPRSAPQSARSIGLPRRYLSSDGRCAIELYLQPGVLIAHGTPRGFNQATNKLKHDCVNAIENAGGYISGIDQENLEISISEFEPHVQCYGSVDRQRLIPSCNNLANQMTASRDVTLFVAGSTIPESFRLPYTVTDPSGGECRLTVSIDSTKAHLIQYSSWYTFYEAMVAINTMCIRNGQRGRWLSIGVSIDHPGSIDVDVGSPQVEEDSVPAATE